MQHIEMTYDGALVGLSIAISIISSYVALELAGITETNHRPKPWYKKSTLSALALGLGIWTMHFTGMVALKLPIAVGYDAIETSLSLLVGVFAGFSGIVIATHRLQIHHTIYGGVVMGLGIAGMHYLGMHAMRLEARMHYDNGLVLLSILLAVIVSCIALRLMAIRQSHPNKRTFNNKIMIAGLMGIAISSLHYTGMSAMSLTLDQQAFAHAHGVIIENNLLTITIAIAAILLIIFPLYVIDYEYRFRELMNAELETLRTHEAHLRTLIENTPDAFFVHDDQGRLLDANKFACKQLGYTRNELMSIKVFDIVANIDKHELLDVIWPSLANGASRSFKSLQIRKDGTQFPVEVNVTGIVDHGKKYIFGMARDITETERLKTHLAMLALTDELTGLANRRSFLTAMDKEISRAQRTREPLSVLMIDLDFFKRLNDRFGHQGGDVTLRHFAQKVTRILRKEDTVGRIGGEEFAVLLPNTAIDYAERIAEKLRIAIENAPVELDAQITNITISVGVAALTGEVTTSAGLLNNADRALYQAKENGRNRVVRYRAG